MKGRFETFSEYVRKEQGREASEKDWNGNCETCAGTGGLLMCMGCNLVYHEKCIVTKIIKEGLKRNEELVCPQCVSVLSEK